MSDREIMDAKRGIVERQSYGFRDPVVKNVVDKFVSRSDVGYEKYGRTLDDERTGGHKNLAGYLNDIQEELMVLIYIIPIMWRFNKITTKVPFLLYCVNKFL